MIPEDTIIPIQTEMKRTGSSCDTELLNILYIIRWATSQEAFDLVLPYEKLSIRILVARKLWGFCFGECSVNELEEYVARAIATAILTLRELKQK